MSAPFKTDVSAEARLGYQEKLLRYLRGEGSTLIAADLATHPERPDLDAYADAAASAAENADADNLWLTRVKLVLALAVQRDTRYAMAGRRYLFAQGMNSKLREDFEVVAEIARVTGGVP